MSEARSYATPPSQSSLQRQEILMPFLERLQLVEGEVAPRIPEGFTFAADLLSLEPWEKETLEDALASGSAERFTVTMAECVAFQAKCISQRHRLGQTTGNDETEAPAPESEMSRRSLIAELTVDTAVGLALLQELQRDIDDLVRGGAMEKAKNLSHLRTRIRHDVTRLKEEIGEDAFADATKRSESLIDPTDEIEREERGEETPDWAKTSTKATGKAGRVVTRDVKRSRKPLYLAGTLLVLLGVWAATILPQLTRPEPTVLGVADFQGLPPIIETIKARPPSLFVQVDADEWARMNEQEQASAVEQIGTIALGAEYTGAQLRDASGRTVASWTQHGGAKVVPAVKPGEAS